MAVKKIYMNDEDIIEQICEQAYWPPHGMPAEGKLARAVFGESPEWMYEAYTAAERGGKP